MGRGVSSSRKFRKFDTSIQPFMKRLFLIFLIAFPGIGISFGNTPDPGFSIIPKPVHAKALPGVFTITANTRLYYPAGDKEAETTATTEHSANAPGTTVGVSNVQILKELRLLS